MPLNTGNLAGNVRRLAGMHLVSIDRLAQFVGVSRETMQAIVARNFHHRSIPRAETAIKIADAFGVTLNALYQEPLECLREGVENFETAPIRDVVEAPDTDLAPGVKMLQEIADIGKARRAKTRKAPERKRRQ
jgi:DNA-binding XRE family transcriptional regulator